MRLSPMKARLLFSTFSHRLTITAVGTVYTSAYSQMRRVYRTKSASFEKFLHQRTSGAQRCRTKALLSKKIEISIVNHFSCEELDDQERSRRLLDLEFCNYHLQRLGGNGFGDDSLSKWNNYASAVTKHFLSKKVHSNGGLNPQLESRFNPDFFLSRLSVYNN